MSITKIVTLQKRLHERGHIRIGQQVMSSNGKMRPAKLDRFRFTSRDSGAIDQVAQLYGGEARKWDNNGSTQFEVFSDATELPVVIPTSMAFSQAFEQWAKGFCTHRCDGVRDTVRDVPCDCNPEATDCKITTRLSVILPEVPGLGTWRIESHGYYAAVELGGALELIESQVQKGVAAPLVCSWTTGKCVGSWTTSRRCSSSSSR